MIVQLVNLNENKTIVKDEFDSCDVRIAIGKLVFNLIEERGCLVIRKSSPFTERMEIIPDASNKIYVK